MAFVNAERISEALNDVFDQAIVYHGFTDYMRDYDVVIYATADPRTGIESEHVRYRFTNCVRATVTSAMPADVWSRSLDERLIDYEQARDLDGYVWGVCWQALYPGAKLLPTSNEAIAWSDHLGLLFFEAEFKANAHNIALVFSDLRVDRVEAGYAPFVVPRGGPDFKIPLP